MIRSRWLAGVLGLFGGLISATEAEAQYLPARPRAGFAMVRPGDNPEVLPTAPSVSAGVHPHWGETWTNSGAAAVPVRNGVAQPKYGWDAYPSAGPEGRREGLRQGCSNTVTCGNFFSDATFVLGSCRQYFGHGRGCGGWDAFGSALHRKTVGETPVASPEPGCPSCESGDYWAR